ncbi:glycosyltransferase family 2 protein [Bryobacter aggregatus]|uniref:glycosyltransferase family 2 protein n=1 Tax=Bryobacter aggregatus TaxID=360054 RepID=UPI0004E0E7FA|nr:glycosyltransferase family 2 protein [Bryobacter aggregatus]
MGERRTVVKPRVSISLVTYNSASCLETLFRSLDAQQDISWDAHIVDNASADSSCEVVKNWGKARLTRNRENVGFGRAHNQHLGRISADYVLIVNPDVNLAPDLLATLANHLDKHPELAVVAPRLIEGGETYPPSHRYLGEALAPLANRPRTPGYAWVHGGCFLIRRQVWEDLNGFDPDYFLYAEEVDLCLRTRRAGWQIAWNGNTIAQHVGRHSIAHESNYRQKQREFAGTLLFWSKHFDAATVQRMVSYEYYALKLRLALGMAGKRRDEFQARHDSCRNWISKHGWAFPWRIIGNRIRQTLSLHYDSH